MKKIIYVLLGILLISTAYAGVTKGFEYLVVDKVKGSDLEVTEFDDEYGFVDQLIYEEVLKRNKNIFSADFKYGITEDNVDYFELEDVALGGRILSDDGSNVKYELVDFEVETTDVDEYGNTQGFGKAILKYKQEIVIEREVPVDVDFDFWEKNCNIDYEKCLNGCSFEETNPNTNKTIIETDKDCEKDCKEEKDECDDEESFYNTIYISGEDVSITLEDNGEKNTVSHRRRCYVGCD